MIVWLHDRLVEEAAAHISIHDRGFLFGDGVFETGLLRAGGFFRLREHLARLHASAATMHIAIPSIRELDEVIRAVVRANGLRDAAVRVTLSRGVRQPVLLVTARPPDQVWISLARQGWRIVTAATRRPSVAAIPAQLKALGRTYALLARHEAAAAGVDDVLLLNDDGHVCEGPSWNIFWRTGHTLFTPSLDTGVLAGVTRSALLQIAGEQGLAVSEDRFPRAALDDADEIFASMTSVGVVPIRELDGRSLPAATPAADTLSVAYDALVARETATDPI